MNIFLTKNEALGNAKCFLLRQVMEAAAKQQGHQITEINEADLVIAFTEQAATSTSFANKKVFVVDADVAFNAPETTIQQAIEQAIPYEARESAVELTNVSPLSSIHNLVAVTACPTGVTQTFMSAEAIMNYAKAQGWQVKVETQGQLVAKDLLTAADIAAADLVLVATDIDTDLSKFIGKRLYRTSTRAILTDTAAEFEQALQHAQYYQPHHDDEVETITPAPRNYANDFETCLGSKKIVALTACPTGVTQTFMSAEAIMTYAKAQGWCIKVETHGQIGSDNLISAEEIADADLVFIAADINVDLTKFTGKPLYRTSTRAVLNNIEQEFHHAFEQATPYTVEQPEDDIITPPTRDFANDFSVCDSSKKIVAVTACPTGITQTFMSAEAIMKYAKTQNWCVKVETRGQLGSDNLITPEEVAAADLVFIAADIDIDLTKFVGKPLYRTSTRATLNQTAQEFEKAFAEATIYTDNKAGDDKKATCPHTTSKADCCQFQCKGARLFPVILIALLIAAVAYFMS